MFPPVKPVILFDLFGTLLDVSKVPKAKMQEYGRVLKQYHTKHKWEELDMEGWDGLTLFPDVAQGLNVFVKQGYRICTLSNCPISFQKAFFSKHNVFIEKVDLTTPQIYKPNAKAYVLAEQKFFRCNTGLVMVTANKTFGDLEAAQQLGWIALHLDRESGQTLIDIHRTLEQTYLK